jgi:hypothetical protein
MFTVFDRTNEPATIVATETYAWAVQLATFGTGVEYPTGRFHRTPPAFDMTLATRAAGMLYNGQLCRGYAGRRS